MDYVSSSNEECDSCVDLISDTQPPQLPPNGFLQPNPLQPIFLEDEPTFKYLQPIPVVQSHLPVVAESSRQLLTPDLASLSNQNLASDPGCLDLVMNSPSDRPLRFTGPLQMEKARDDPVDSVLTVHSIKGSNQATGRKRKKRTRASQRAPTTVMTTDEANFRAMVQQFTGIPATYLVPPHLHRAGIGLLGPNQLGFGSNLQPQLTYNSLPGPFAPKTKSAAFNDQSLSPQFTQPSDLGLLNFQPFVQVQDPTDVTGSKTRNGSGKYSIWARASDVGRCTNEPVDHSAPAVDFQGDQIVKNDVIFQ